MDSKTPPWLMTPEQALISTIEGRIQANHGEVSVEPTSVDDQVLVNLPPGSHADEAAASAESQGWEVVSEAPLILWVPSDSCNMFA